MKYGILAIVIAAIMVTGCAPRPATKSYETTVTVEPVSDPRYAVHVSIVATHEDGKQDILSTPGITLPPGEEGQVNVPSDKEGNGIFCTMLINEKPGKVEALTTVVIKEDGMKVLNTTQKTVIKRYTDPSVRAHAGRTQSLPLYGTYRAESEGGRCASAMPSPRPWPG